MNILWIANSLLPEAESQLGGNKEIKGTGGWVFTLANGLIENEGINISIAAITPIVKKLTVVKGKRITYYAIPYEGDVTYHNNYEKAYKEICDIEHPDVIHIHGTEYPHSLAAINACGPNKTLVSIQGMVSVYAPYYMGGISPKEARSCFTFRSLFRPSLMAEQREMKKRGLFEIETLKKAKYVTGRTSWDRENTWAINPNAVFLNCARILRDEFYKDEWIYGKCSPHSIFLSQAGYPLKGLHKVIDAMSIVMKIYPDVQLRVAGHDITFSDASFKDRLRISSYGKLIRRKIRDYHLENNVKFTGPLNANGIKAECLRSNVFICPSSIENSPNSLGEAQILGVPCIASYVGGSMDMMRGDEDNLYRFEEVGMLAAKICAIFEKGSEIDTSTMRDLARKRHDKETIVQEQLNIYKRIIEDNNSI